MKNGISRELFMINQYQLVFIYTLILILDRCVHNGSYFCQNGGSCISGNNDFVSCNCPIGFNGSQCEHGKKCFATKLNIVS